MSEQEDTLRNIPRTPGVEVAGAYVYTATATGNRCLICAICGDEEIRTPTSGWPPFWRCAKCGHVGVVIDLTRWDRSE